ncbi:MAG: hypothetical protein OSB05_00220 [Akkermansiaceae bacterium]|nr:hypothetical protein [Akkermansiaceae bacterium]
MKRLFILPFLLQMAFGDSLTVPSFTAYLDPNPNGARVTTDAGITRWSDPKIKVQWFGQINSIGELTAKVEVEINKDDKLNLSLTLGKEIRKVSLIGKGTSPVIADFGKFNIKKKGYHSFVLSSPAPLLPAEKSTRSFSMARQLQRPTLILNHTVTLPPSIFPIRSSEERKYQRSIVK